LKGNQRVSYFHKSFDGILTSIWIFFHYSATRTSHLAEVQQALGEDKVKIVKACHTRWLSHDRAVSAILKSIKPLLTTLKEEKTNPTAKGLFSKRTGGMRTYNFIASLCLVADVVSLCSRLSVRFQAEALDFSVIDAAVSTTREAIVVQADIPGPQMRRLPELLIELKEFDIDCSDTIKLNWENRVKKVFLASVRDQLNAQFPSSKIVSAMSILFDPSAIASDNKEFGRHELKIIVDHYKMDLLDLETEWIVWKKSLVGKKDSSIESIITNLLNAPKVVEFFPLLSQIAKTLFCIPLTSVDCERGFSCMNRIMTSARNRMSVNTLDALMRISLHGPKPEALDFDACVRTWYGKSDRRICLY